MIAYILFSGKRPAQKAAVFDEDNSVIAELFEKRDYIVARDIILNMIRNRGRRGMIAVKRDLDIPLFSEDEATGDLLDLPFAKMIIREKPRPRNLFQELTWNRTVLDNIPAGHDDLTLRMIMRIHGYPDNVPFFSGFAKEISPAFLEYIALSQLVKNGWWKKYRVTLKDNRIFFTPF